MTQPEPWLDVFARPQRLVDIGAGRRLNLYDTGEGPVTVILAHGFGGRTLSWHKVQPAVAEFARVIAYDRAGFGFSDPGPMPRTVSRSVADLRAALAEQGAAPPFLLVGHSAGSLDVRYFACRYPQDVAGIVISDGSSEGQRERFEAAVPHFMTRVQAAIDNFELNATYAEHGRFQTDYARYLPPPEPHLTDAVNAALRDWYGKASTWQAMASEYRSLYGAGSDEVLAVRRDLGALPIVVLTAGHRDWPGLAKEDSDKLLTIWRAQQREFAALSSRGTCREVADSGHAIPFERPEAVIAAIREVAEMIG